MQGTRRKARLTWRISAGAAALTGLIAALPATGVSAVQPHDPWKLQQGRAVGDPLDISVVGRCDVCHTLSTTDGEAGTSYIISSSRTLNAMKLYRGGPFLIDDYFGCTFCHSNMLDNVSMDDVLTDFEFTSIKHPMGRLVDGVTNTNNEFLSTVDTADAANELQCINCHDPAIIWPGGLAANYPYHEGKTNNPGAIWDGTWNPTNNPLALRNVTAAAHAEKEHCVNTCHGDLGGGNSAIRPRMGHYDWGNYNGTTIYDASGQALAVAGSTCTICHDTHTSQKPGLIQDGLDRLAPDPGRTAINEATCVAVCHASGAFATHGHGGKPGINSTTCMPCHTSSIRHRDTSTAENARRLGFTYSSATMGDLATNRAGDGLDNNMNGSADEAAEATFTYNKYSICRTCHINYAGHGSGARAASCLDCHDMHGDDAAANNNAAMVRSSILGENTVFTAADRAATPKRLFRTANTTGMCDNAACHSNITTNLATDHLGGPIDDTTDCFGCHVISHTADPGTDLAFKAQMDCTFCHSYPPVAADTTRTGIATVVDHTRRRRGGAASSSSDVDFLAAHNGCTLCHGISGNAQLDGFANAEPGGGGKDAYLGSYHRDADIQMNGISVPDNSQNADYQGGTGGCARACHGADWVVGENLGDAAIFATANTKDLREFGSGACNGCHGNTVSGAYWPDDSANTIPTANNAGRHPRHMTVIAARLGITLPGSDAQQKQICEYCHQAVTNDGDHGVASSLPAEALVGIYRKTLWATVDGDAAYVGGTDVCSNVDCHAGRTTLDGTYGWYDAGTVGTTNCNMCHDEAPATNAHAAHMASNALTAADNQDDCAACHAGTMNTATTPDTPLAYSTTNLHVNGANNVSFAAAYDYEAAGGTGTSGSGASLQCSDVRCHNGVQTPTWGAGTISCGQCHNTGGTGPLPSAGSVVGKHPNHANNDGDFADCQQCHPSANSYSATGGHANHQNLTVNVSISVATYADGNGVGGVNYSNGAENPDIDNGTCTFTSGCHGTGTPSWAPTASLANGCFDCHGGVNATEATTTKPVVDGLNPNPVNLPQYNAAGHGQSGNFPGSGTGGPAYLYTNTGVPNNGCYECHDSGATHAPDAGTTDPYRLGAFATDTNGLCARAAGCHTLAEIQSHTEAIVAMGADWAPTGATDYDWKCVDCHDPHGDANYFMIRSHISAPTTTADTVFGSDQYGTPQDTPIVAASAITFTSLAGNVANSYGVNGTTNGICEVCHVDTAEVAYYRRGNTETNTHNTSGACTSCHVHSDGFAANCYGCHGNSANATLWPDTGVSPPVNIASYPDRDGRHTVHMTLIMNRFNANNTWATNPTTDRTLLTMNDADQLQICAYCHTDDVPNFGHSTHYVSTWNGTNAQKQAAQPADVGSFNIIWNGGSDANGAMVATTYDGSFNVTAATSGCSAIDCHNSKTTPTAAPNDSRWYGANASTCFMCHTADGSANNPASGVHRNSPSAPTVSAEAHDESFAGGAGTCSGCHDPAGQANHINGAFTANDTNDGTNEYYLTAAMDGAYTDAALNSGTCSGAAVGGANCHDGGDAGTWVRKWSATAYDTLASGNPCVNCHGGFSNDWTFGGDQVVADGSVSHTRNWDGDGSAEVMGNHTTCKICHGMNSQTDRHANYTATTMWDPTGVQSKHGNNLIEMNGPTPSTGTGYNDPSVGTASDFGCDNAAACHGNDWTGAYPAGTGHRLEDSGWTVGFVNFGGARCDSCHGYPPLGDGGANDLHAVGTEAVDHEAVSNDNGAILMAQHNQCGYCHGVRANGTMDGFVVQSPAALNGVYTYDPLVDHRDGRITMNDNNNASATDDANYNPNSGGCANAACHPDNAAHQLDPVAGPGTWPTTSTQQPRDIGPGMCSTCHADGGASGAPQINTTVSSPHIDYNGATAGGGGDNGCTDCHAGHADGTSGANDVEIPTRYGATQVPTMNNLYSTHSYAIKLGGTQTASYPSTEAQMCWGCHYAQRAQMGDTFAEFGVNNNAVTGGMAYNYGTLSTWTATGGGGWYQTNGTTVATWYTAQRSAPSFAYKDGAIQSMHGANFNAAGPGNDPVAAIRCSYCHDVHDTGNAPNGAPYLRGTWKGNPFREDGAPMSTTNYPTFLSIGPFPRPSKSSTTLGGYQINQNFTSSTTEGNTAGLGGDTDISNWAGLCERCHNSPTATAGNGTWTAAEIDGIDWGLYTVAVNNDNAASVWSGGSLGTHGGVNLTNANSNGHSNSVLGGTGKSGSADSDIYNERIRNTAWAIAAATNGSTGGRPSMVYQQDRSANINAYGFRGHTSSVGDGHWTFPPAMNNLGWTRRIKMYNSYDWGSGAYGSTGGPSGMVTIFAGGSPDFIDNQFHQFPCSKCHIPHASRLPRLMITNCLDTDHATWSRGTPFALIPTSPAPASNIRNEPVNGLNRGKAWPETTVANNCHRTANTATGSLGQGWNTVTPW